MDNRTKYEHPDFFLFLNLYFFFRDCETRGLLRKRENIDTVLAEIKQLFEQFHHQQIGIITARTDQWYEGELTHFLERH